MALERSVLDRKSICTLMWEHYGITVKDIQKLPLGSANCYRITDGCKNYFLKELQSAYSRDEIVREAELVEFLASAGIPVSSFYKTLSGEFTFVYREHVICLEEYVDGETYGYDDLPLHLLPKIAGMLGRLHSAMKAYPMHADMDREWLDSFSSYKLAGQYSSLICDAVKLENDSNVERIIADLEYKKELASRCERYKKYFEGITYSPSHGDYQGCQLIFEGGEVKAVIDFSSARTLPVTWEIMRSFVQSSEKCNKNACVDIPALCEYVREYMKHAPLTEKDMKAMPYVYLFQLARSKYGYPQYLNPETEDRERLLAFASWRTSMCREIERKAELIAEELSKQI